METNEKLETMLTASEIMKKGRILKTNMSFVCVQNIINGIMHEKGWTIAAAKIRI